MFQALSVPFFLLSPFSPTLSPSDSHLPAYLGASPREHRPLCDRSVPNNGAFKCKKAQLSSQNWDLLERRCKPCSLHYFRTFVLWFFDRHAEAHCFTMFIKHIMRILVEAHSYVHQGWTAKELLSIVQYIRILHPRLKNVVQKFQTKSLCQLASVCILQLTKTLGLKYPALHY